MAMMGAQRRKHGPRIGGRGRDVHGRLRVPAAAVRPVAALAAAAGTELGGLVGCSPIRPEIREWPSWRPRRPTISPCHFGHCRPVKKVRSGSVLFATTAPVARCSEPTPFRPRFWTDPIDGPIDCRPSGGGWCRDRLSHVCVTGAGARLVQVFQTTALPCQQTVQSWAVIVARLASLSWRFPCKIDCLARVPPTVCPPEPSRTSRV